MIIDILVIQQTRKNALFATESTCTFPYKKKVQIISYSVAPVALEKPHISGCPELPSGPVGISSSLAWTLVEESGLSDRNRSIHGGKLSDPSQTLTKIRHSILAYVFVMSFFAMSLLVFGIPCQERSQHGPLTSYCVFYWSDPHAETANNAIWMQAA